MWNKNQSWGAESPEFDSESYETASVNPGPQAAYLGCLLVALLSWESGPFSPGGFSFSISLLASMPQFKVADLETGWKVRGPVYITLDRRAFFKCTKEV